MEQPIADRVAQNLEIISKNLHFSTRRTRILMGFIIYHLVLIVDPMGRILVHWTKFKDDLEILCHPICNRLYHIQWVYSWLWETFERAPWWCIGIAISAYSWIPAQYRVHSVASWFVGTHNSQWMRVIAQRWFFKILKRQLYVYF